MWYEEENRTLGLEDICFQPLSPDNNKCTLMSALNYWQNDLDNLNKEIYDDSGFFKLADYIDHFSYCVR